MTKIYEPIAEEGIIDEINRLCNTTNDSYKNRQKIARLNEGLDYYFFLAAQAAPQGTFDDNTKTAAPIETQNLVSGTNAYKITDFTNNVLQILRVAVLDSDGYEHNLAYEDFEDIQDGFQEEYDTENTGLPHAWTKVGDYIYLKATPDYNSTNGLKVYVNRELSKFQYQTFTVTIANPGVLTKTAHGLSDSDGLLLITDGALPTGLTAEKTIYYVSGKTADTFKLATTPSNVGATEIETTGSQSGTHKFIKVSGEPGIPLIHHPFLARFASSKFIKPNHPNFAKTMSELAQDRIDIQDYWQSVVRPGKTIMETKKRATK